jgi:transposase InsO family protein
MSVTYRFSIAAACDILGVTPQAFYKSPKLEAGLEEQVVRLVQTHVLKARKKCPTRGCRSMYEEFGELLPIGRDKSINLFMNLGFRVRYPKRYGKATQSGTREFPNLLVQKTVKGINQVWQADMAHYLFGNTKMYTVYITDVYSQEIVGRGAFDSNVAENYAQVLKQAIGKARSGGQSLKGLIHHSDGGKQYESKHYKRVCKRNGIEQSMCIYSYENPYAEKTNDLINNGYLNVWRPMTLSKLVKLQALAVKDHNTNRRKKVLGKLSPIKFRTQLNKDKHDVHYTLELKPRVPEQPRKRNEIKTLTLTGQLTE